MSPSTRLALPMVVVAVAVAIAVAAIGVVDPALASAGFVRIALGVCGIGFLVVAATYARDGYRAQAAGHALAGIGFVVAASGAEGTIAWVGVLLLGGGGLLLFRDATSGTDARRPGRGPNRRRQARGRRRRGRQTRSR